MRLLIITPLLPYPLTTGGAQAQYNLIDCLRNEISISIMFPIQKSFNKQESFEFLKKQWNNVNFFPFVHKRSDHGIDTLLILLRKFILRKIKNKQSITEILIEQSGDYFTKSFLINLEHVLNNNNFDIIQIEFYNYLSLVCALSKVSSKCLFVHHEINYIRNQTLLDSKNITTSYDSFLFNKDKAIELSYLNLYDGIITLTEMDRNKLMSDGVTTRIYSSPATVSSKLVNFEEFKFNNKLTFIGPSTHFPNIDGIEWFLSFIWNKILDLNPNLELIIIGTWSSDLQKKYLSKFKNIRFVGFVEDLNSVLRNTISIIPIRIGSGMRMKIIESVVLGCPFISTSVGAEGLDFNDQTECLIEDNPDYFASRLISLTNNPEEQLRLSRNARIKYQNSYSTEALTNKRLGIYKEILNYNLNEK